MLDNLIKKVAVYLRISREDKENEDTLLNHRTIMQTFVASRGFNEAVYYEEIVSGAKAVEHRHELFRLLQDIKKYDALCILKLDRLSRDELYFYTILKVLEDNNIPLITSDGRQYNLRDKNDRMMLGIQNLFASNEYRTIVERMQENKLVRANRGEWIQGIPPLGYKRNDDKKLVIDESETFIVKQIFDYAESGYGLPTIVNKLIGYRTAKGKPFTVTAVHAILCNKTYLGIITYNTKDESIVCKNAHEPIITREQFNRVQDALRGRYSGDRETRTRSKGKVISVLKDLVYCNECGLKMGLKKDSKQVNTIYLKACKCGNKGIAEHRLLNTFISEFQFIKAHLHEEWEKALNASQDVSKDSLVKSISELNKTADKLKKRLEGYIEMRADGELTKEQYQKKKGETESELKRLSDAINDLQEQLQSLDKETITSQYEAKMEKIDRFFYLYNKEALLEDIAECNRILKLLINKARYVRGDSESVITSPLERYEASQGMQQDFVQLVIEPK
jgi:site-specific DNA recombinase